MNIPGLLTPTVERFPHHPALVYGQRGWTYGEWMARILRFAGALSDLGVRPSDRVVFYLTASGAAVTTYFACHLLGAIAVPINFRLASAEVAYILEGSGARVLVYDQSLNEAAGIIARRVRTVHDYISCAPEADSASCGHHQFEALAEQTEDGGLLGLSPAPGSHSALVYTSGTTGRPKGVMHSHGNDASQRRGGR